MAIWIFADEAPIDALTVLMSNFVADLYSIEAFECFLGPGADLITSPRLSTCQHDIFLENEGSDIIATVKAPRCQDTGDKVCKGQVRTEEYQSVCYSAKKVHIRFHMELPCSQLGRMNRNIRVY